MNSATSEEGQLSNWKICKHKPLCNDSQQYNANWYHPIFGCDSLSLELEEFYESGRRDALKQELDFLKYLYGFPSFKDNKQDFILEEISMRIKKLQSALNNLNNINTKILQDNHDNICKQCKGRDLSKTKLFCPYCGNNKVDNTLYSPLAEKLDEMPDYETTKDTAKVQLTTSKVPITSEPLPSDIQDKKGVESFDDGLTRVADDSSDKDRCLTCGHKASIHLGYMTSCSKVIQNASYKSGKNRPRHHCNCKGFKSAGGIENE